MGEMQTPEREPGSVGLVSRPPLRTRAMQEGRGGEGRKAIKGDQQVGEGGRGKKGCLVGPAVFHFHHPNVVRMK